MALSSVSYVGNGSTSLYSVTFPYLDKTHVKVFVGGVAVTAFTFTTSSSITLTVPPANLAVILIQRVTPTTPIVDFVNGSTLTESLLDTATLQTLYITEESKDTILGALALDLTDNKFDASSKVIKNLATPVNAADATTKAYVDSTTASSAASALASASSATASASSAATSASNAAASYDSFDDRYLGVIASNPTLDNDGNALLVGALYFNSTANELRSYTGTVWQSITVPADGSITPAKLSTGAPTWNTAGQLTVVSPSLLGYGTGAGGVVTQLTSKATAVTLNKPSGQITMNGAALAANGKVAFSVNNTVVDINTNIVLSVTGGTANPNDYLITARAGSGFFVVIVRNENAASLSDALIIQYSLIKGVSA